MMREINQQIWGSRTLGLFALQNSVCFSIEQKKQCLRSEMSSWPRKERRMWLGIGWVKDYFISQPISYHNDMSHLLFLSLKQEKHILIIVYNFLMRYEMTHTHASALCSEGERDIAECVIHISVIRNVNRKFVLFHLIILITSYDDRQAWNRSMQGVI